MSDLVVDVVNKDMAQLGKRGPLIRIVGVGGGGCNALQYMINQSVPYVECIAINTDAQALNKSTAPLKVQIGVKLTNGLGAGCDPNKGRKAADESREDLKKLLQGSDIVFIAAGMGGGTGTGAAPVIAKIARDCGALVISIVTRPFAFEGRIHSINASAGITELSKYTDSIIVVENDKLLTQLGANISILGAFNAANDILYNAAKGIIDCILAPGFINLDIRDVITIMRARGRAMIGIGSGQGVNFVEEAIQHAIQSPLIELSEIKNATGLLVNAYVSHNFPISKWYLINNEIMKLTDIEADCKYGIVFDDSLADDEITISVIITGFSNNENKPSAVGAKPHVAVGSNAPAYAADANGFFKQAVKTKPENQ